MLSKRPNDGSLGHHRHSAGRAAASVVRHVLSESVGAVAVALCHERCNYHRRAAVCHLDQPGATVVGAAGKCGLCVHDVYRQSAVASPSGIFLSI